MKVELTKGECRWLINLVVKDKQKAEQANEQTPHPLLELRRDNMEELRKKLNKAMEKEMNKYGRG